MSFIATIFERCRATGEGAVLYEVRGDALVAESGRALLSNVAAVRGFLRAAGVARGDRVALLGPNSAAWVAVDLAIMAEGAICVPLYARQDPRELAGMLRDCAPALLLAADATLADAIAAAWLEHSRIARYDEALSATPIDPAAPPLADDDPATIIYTSGTSGEPKGVLLTQQNIEYMLGVTVRELSKMAGAGRAQDRVFHYLPFCFAGSRVMLLSQLHRGNPLMLSTDLTRLQQELAVALPHYCLNVPALLERIRKGVLGRLQQMGGAALALYTRAAAAHARRARHERLSLRERALLRLVTRVLFPRIKRLIGPNLEFLACGSAALSDETQRWFQMIGIPVYQVYGLTETTAIVTIDDTTHVTPGRVGRAIDGCEIRLSDEGELLCRGPNVFAGYWNRPDATAAVMRDGWFATGDQAEIDGDGNVKIIGRVKEVLVPESGHNVAPGPLEQRLLDACNGAEHALVIGHGRPYLTALVTGAVDVGELERVREAVNAQVPHYMRLRRLSWAKEPFTVENGLLTANQKLKRKAIESRYREAIEQMYR
jgi:long-chain acyl-CoA synthetase